MLKYPITYTNFDGQKVTEDFYFNLTKAELLKLEAGIAGGLAEKVKKSAAENDKAAIFDIIEKFVLCAYGVKNGKDFSKTNSQTGIRYSDLFKDTEAYSELFLKLVQDDKEAAKFINAVIPTDIAEKVKEEQAKQAKKVASEVPSAVN